MSNPIKFSRTAYRSGGSITVSIPSEIIAALDIKEKEPINIFVEGERIIIEKRE